MVDTAFVCARNTFLGIPYGYTSYFFSDDSDYVSDNTVVHRNTFAYITKQQHKLFI
jgi:hypothetical protein